MTDLYVFTAGNKEAREHLDSSIRNPIPEERVLQHFDQELQEKLRHLGAEQDGLYAWGATPGPKNISNWKRMSEGDFVLAAFDGSYRFYSRVMLKVDNESFAADVWGRNKKEETWRYSYFLSKPAAVSVPFSDVDDYLHGRYLGFTRISGERLENIRADYGSVQQFLDQTMLLNSAPPQNASPWTDQEIEDAVSDYFEMLGLELDAKPYNKSAHRRTLAPKLQRRSKTAIERKHQNISSILDQLGLPFIRGYKPLSNLQTALLDHVVEYLGKNKEIVERLDRVIGDTTPATSPPQVVIGDLFVDPPAATHQQPSSRAIGRVAKKINYAERDRNNRTLGLNGEQFVVAIERQTLDDAGRPDLAAKVEWTSVERGDGLGYDIRSFESDGSEVFIEVKTTNGGSRSPFFISSNEVSFSDEVGSAFRLYRLYNFSREPKIYVIAGPLSCNESIRLAPKQYECRI